MQKKGKTIAAWVGGVASVGSILLFFFPNSAVCERRKLFSGEPVRLSFGKSVVYYVKIRRTTSGISSRPIALDSGGRRKELLKFPEELVHSNNFGHTVFLDKDYLETNGLDPQEVRFSFSSEFSLEMTRCQIAAPLSVYYNQIFYPE